MNCTHDNEFRNGLLGLVLTFFPRRWFRGRCIAANIAKLPELLKRP